MIPVEAHPEPHSFDLIRQQGRDFLQKTPNPTSEQWKNRDYWRKALPDMRVSYGRICSYCAHWIPAGTGNDSIDHFIPKSKTPSLAYEWHNFRYVSLTFNGRKGTKEIIDPFNIQYGWFELNFKSLYVHPSDALEMEQRQLVEQTIEILKLNIDDALVKERFKWFMNYYEREITFKYLSKNAPFIAYELQRQGLVNDQITEIVVVENFQQIDEV